MDSWSGYFMFSQLCSLFLLGPVVGMRTRDKIYINLKTQNACILNLNATHEIGCRSSMSGNVGVVYYIQTYNDYDWVLAVGPHAPYVAVLNSVDFNLSSLERLEHSNRVNGILIITLMNQSSESSYPPLGYSSVNTCPNDMYGMYGKTQFAHCKMALWNRSGTSARLRTIDLPVVEVSDPEDVDAVLNKCFFAFNNNLKVYPACAAELKTKMDAAVDSVTCIRRSRQYHFSLSQTKVFCDPLADKNVVATMKPVPANDTRIQGSVVMVVTRLDAASIFQHTRYAADTAVSGIVTLLAAAEALWKVRDIIRDNQTAKDIMFVFFQGETFDYIGSSRMVYDMEKQTFPCNSKSNPDNLANIDLDHLDQIVEVNQVGHRTHGQYVWAHTDPVKMGYVKDEVKQMIEDLKAIGTKENVEFSSLSDMTPLPPASTQRFLLKRNIPAVVLTDHVEMYSNKYYNSRFDTAYHIDADDYPQDSRPDEKYDYVTLEAQLLANLSTVLAQYLYKASMGNLPPYSLIPQLTADPMTVTHLLYCFLVTPNCKLFAESLDANAASDLYKRTEPFSFYVGTADDANNVTIMVHNLMARFTGQLEQYSEGWCIRRRSKMYRHVWMQGPLSIRGQRIGWCFKSLVFFTEALSPAFIIPDYSLMSTEYSSWTESRWGTSAISVRLFLLPSMKYQIFHFFVGLIIFILSLMAVFIFVRKAEVIFSVGPLPPAKQTLGIF
ncbi:hypothetical protein BsWGS_28519 [Bradybaena similaris]